MRGGRSSGRSVSVSETISLPAQPSDGIAQLIPLGGNGFQAPHSVVAVRARLAHDASAGNAEIAVRFDPRYTQVLSYAQAELEDGTGSAEDYRLELQCTALESLAVSGAVGGVSVSGKAVTHAVLWSPPAIMCAVDQSSSAYPRLRFTVNNTNTFTSRLTCRIFNFDIRAREVMPLGILLESFSRAGSAQVST